MRRRGVKEHKLVPNARMAPFKGLADLDPLPSPNYVNRISALPPKESLGGSSIDFVLVPYCG